MNVKMKLKKISLRKRSIGNMINRKENGQWLNHGWTNMSGCNVKMLRVKRSFFANIARNILFFVK
jgi:hypothetical protein